MSNYAPIAVSTYVRIEHLKKTIFSLQRNTIAHDSKIFIFSDAPKQGDTKKVEKIRKYLYTIKGFKEVNIIERKTNSRVLNNRDGIKKLLDTFGRVIFLEDDIVTAPGFLQFMNDALDFYEKNQNILSVSGHTPNLNIFKYSTDDVYLSKRFHGWGVGFWKRKYDLIKDIPDWRTCKKDRLLLKNLKKMGQDMVSMIKLEANGDIDALDIKACYLCAKKGYTNLLPTMTLVKNIGMDCSGVHCGNYNPFYWDKLSNKINFRMIPDIEPIPEYLNEYSLFFSKKQKIINKIKKYIYK